MSLSKRDVLATALVGVAVILAVLWAMELLPAAMSARWTGFTILALGFLASASAVVPSFAQLLHGNKLYLGVTSVLGLVALVAGVLMLVNATGPALGVVMATMVVLWLISTMHHSSLAKSADRSGEASAAPVDRSGTTVG